MFTKEFIIKAANLEKAEEHANQIKWRLRELSITPDVISIDALNNVIKLANDNNQQIIDYIASFIPDKLMKEFNELGVKKITGGFATNITGSASLNAEITIAFNDFDNHGNITLKFDNTKHVLYHEGWSARDDIRILVSKYLQASPKGFNCWIREKDFE